MYSEKATNLKKKISPACFDIYSVTSKQVGDYFKLCGLFRKPVL